MDYFFAVMIFIALTLNFTLLCGLVGSGASSSILDLFDKKFKQYRLAGDLAKAVEKANKDFKAVVIIHGDYEILVARKVKGSTND
ncbi:MULTISPECIES: hypothetical protein [unclassified Gilliamella]|uniref:hypothetical protein n=1 Tax=unclassified Gilliamella TaxID=2685620 RepID=UPI00226A25E5|nr:MULTISPECIES: hypothetical protein [unclassified Gilliamella]MCX8641696.1 hypothetical protein [Gilliamella sp. B3835]MCX8706497.1 hypothetical protein [Gilliamella sp. B3783]MCX8709160.1 hypothetical protein [Gilliamella sp. B3780]MCX8714532.1 hypothetical protein [Gilliamella sp. B3781]MCX8715899.1 hypothetical protein [Gilliamella sp. B3784]